MNKRRNLCKIMMAALLGVIGLLGLFGRPTANVLAAPTAIPTKMSNTLISAEVSKATANPGDTFDVTISMNTDTQTLGAQFALQFDPSLVQIDANFDQGGFYKDYAAAHNGTFLLFPKPVIDNNSGSIKTTGMSVIGIPIGAGGPSGSGVLLVFHGKVKDGANGIAKFTFSDVIVSDTGDVTGRTQALGGVMVQGGVLSVGGSSPAPTLAPIAAIAAIPGIQSGPTPSTEPTIAPITTDESNNSSVPWIIILPVLGLVIVGAGAFLVLRKK